MSLVQTLLYYVPTYVLMLLAVATWILFSVIGLWLFRKVIPVHVLKLHNDIAGFIFATLGVIYAVLVAFMVVVSWHSFDTTTKNLEKEANTYADIYRDSAGVGRAFHRQVAFTLNRDVKSVVNDEWPMMAKGVESRESHDLIHKVWNVFKNYEPKGEREKIFFAEAVRKMNEANELRRQRIADAGAGIHPILWLILIVSGLITLSFTFFFGTENYVAQMIMTSLLAALIALILFTIMVFDYPFTGGVRVSPEAFKTILMSLKAF